MEARVTKPILRWLIFAGLAAASGLLAFGGARHALAAHWEGSSNPDLWVRAARIEPSNAENWERLGRYRQFDFEHADLPLAITYYWRAARIDPESSFYWMDLASVYETTGKLAQAEQAYRTAQSDYPISGEVAWQFGNFLLRRGRVAEAFQQIRHALVVEPKLTTLAVSRCWQSTQDVDQIVDTVLPSTPAAYWGAMAYFVRAHQADAVMAVWKRIIAERTPFALTKAFPPLDMLIESARAEDAVTIWRQALAIAGVPSEHDPQDSLVWNGGFEQELANGGFGWRYRPVAGAQVDFDEGTFHSGSRSLRIIFDGSANVAFRNIWQYVAVEPNMRYHFSAFTKTQDLTTESGIRIVIQDMTDPESPAQSTPNVVGTQPWALDDLEFTTSADTRLLLITLVRPPSALLNNKVYGTVWVDDISLVPEPKTSGQVAP
jgi:hypothetical protein